MRVKKRFSCVINPRRAGVFGHPEGFRSYLKKWRRSAPPFMTRLFIHLFRTCCKNFRPRSLKVRSPGYVK